MVIIAPNRKELIDIAGGNQRIALALEELFLTVGADSNSDVGNLANAVFGLQQSGGESAANLALAALGELADSLSQGPVAQPPRRKRFGAFCDTTTQTAAAINTAQAVTFNTTTISQGAWIGSPSSRVYVDEYGVYNCQISVQFDSTSGGNKLVEIWFRINGADVANSASRIRVQGNNGEVFSAVNVFLELKSGDYVEVMFAADSIDLQLLAIAATSPVPAIPSIILTINNGFGE